MAEEGFRTDRVSISAEVLLSKDIVLPVKGLYTVMIALAGKGGVCHLTEQQLAELTMTTDTKTIRKYLGILIRAGLIHLEKKSHYVILDPVTNHFATLLKDAQRRLARAEYIGETLMREWLTLLVALINYQDNARLPSIKNPQTRELLELDRFYPPHVAFEFNGPQHYGPTVKYPDPVKAIELEVRDLIKQAQCVRNGITLVIVKPEDLSREGMLRRIGDLLPLRPGAGESVVAEFLEKESWRYRRRYFD